MAALLFALLILLLLPLVVLAADLPKLTGRVVDTAGMIDPATKTALVQKLEAFEKKSSDQIVVATVNSLDGEAIEPYANRLFRAWGLGQGGENNGILLLVAKSDRKMRIEVGYGLEGTLTDLHSKLIIENTMVPAFRAGDFSGGISRATDDIITVLDGNAAELEARSKRNPYVKNNNSLPDVDWIFVIFIALWATIFLGGMAMAILPPIFGTKIGPNRYRWLGMDVTVGGRSSGRSPSGWSSGSSSGGWSSGGGGWSSGSSSGGGFSGGGGSSGGGGASGSW
ncbi:TPM domain-containing protein [Mesorhizobium sp. IMUNJ 23232]|uniref:TPM domain-containing protein n=1 Tax=Mesorhizobium sp. IMUNJ 23232 TaxID=3376064 RepID=UPI003799E069